MAKSNSKSNSKSNVNSDSRTAGQALDSLINTARADMAKPAHLSNIKKTASVAGVLGAGVGLGAWIFG